MAELCLDCWNKLSETKDKKWRYAMSWEKELCEECGQYKRVILSERLSSRTQKLLAESIEGLKGRK